MIGAGMSKLGGHASACWRELSCTTTHYSTQPMPNALAWLFHRAPLRVHQLEVTLTFFEQLVLPFAFLVPLRSVRLAGALGEIFFQFVIVATGEYITRLFINHACAGLLDCFMQLRALLVLHDRGDIRYHTLAVALSTG
jgi:hypothetical protein